MLNLYYQITADVLRAFLLQSRNLHLIIVSSWGDTLVLRKFSVQVKTSGVLSFHVSHKGNSKYALTQSIHKTTQGGALSAALGDIERELHSLKAGKRP